MEKITNYKIELTFDRKRGYNAKSMVPESIGDIHPDEEMQNLPDTNCGKNWTYNV